MTLHGGNIFAASEKSGIPPGKIMDFSASINPLGMPKTAGEAIRKQVSLLPHYPEPYARSLAILIARHYRVSEKSVICGNGSTELIYLIPRALKPKRVLVTSPTFSEYEKACRNSDEKIRTVDYRLRREDSFDIDPDSFIRSMRGCDMAFLCNPNNPTGRLVRKRDVLAIADAAMKQKCHLIVDEAFIDFCPRESVIKAVSRNPYLIVLRSMTKFYALAGLRLGFGVFPPGVAEVMNKLKEPWTVNSLAWAAGKAVLRDSAYQAASIENIRKEKELLEKGLAKLGIAYVPSDANYYLLLMNNAGSVVNSLAKKGILVRDCSNFHGLDRTFIRIAVRTRRENRRLMKELSTL
jgi:threonine-phosphate decarboxylase